VTHCPLNPHRTAGPASFSLSWSGWHSDAASPSETGELGAMVATRSQTAALCTDCSATDTLHQDVYILILSQLGSPAAAALARCTMVSSTFAEAVVGALRLRRPNQPAALPAGFDTWLQKLLFDERRSEVYSPALSVGRTHAATTHAGRVFVWGSEYVSYAGREVIGMLGVGMRNTFPRHVFENDLLKPTPLSNVTCAVSVSCGREHTLVLSSDGSVHAFGAPHDTARPLPAPCASCHVLRA
jgi:hypothetical protein